MSAALDRVLARRQRHVAVLAGDGTVRDVVERLARLPPGHWLPDLLILPGGRSNLTAADLVPRGDALGTLATALARAGDGRWDAAVVERRPLCIVQAPAPPRFGFFFGGAAVDNVVRRAQDHRYGGSGPFAHRPSELALGARQARCARPGRPRRTCPRRRSSHRGRRLRQPARRDASAAGDDAAAPHRPVRSLRGARPRRAPAHRGHGRGAALLAGFAAPADGPILGGHECSTTAISAADCERVQITGLAGYVLDGERFDTDPARPVAIVPGPRLRFFSR